MCSGFQLYKHLSYKDSATEIEKDKETETGRTYNLSSLAGCVLLGEPVLGQRLAAVQASHHTEGWGVQRSPPLCNMPLMHKITISRRNSSLFPFGERRKNRVRWIY